MPRFFITDAVPSGDRVCLNKADSGHIKVLRIRQGETFTVCDGKGTDYFCRLENMSGDCAVAEILERTPSLGEPGVFVSVYLGYAKGDRVDVAVQKCVELGASEIVLFPSERCVSRPDAKSVPKKLARWAAIAESAAKQSGRGIIPEIRAADSFKEAVSMASQADVSIFFYEEEKTATLRAALESRPDAKTVAIMTGPEGGFDPKEAALAAEGGMVSTTLGTRILRCETAPAAALAAIMYHTGNL